MVGGIVAILAAVMAAVVSVLVEDALTKDDSDTQSAPTVTESEPSAVESSQNGRTPSFGPSSPKASSPVEHFELIYADREFVLDSIRTRNEQQDRYPTVDLDATTEQDMTFDVLTDEWFAIEDAHSTTPNDPDLSTGLGYLSGVRSVAMFTSRLAPPADDPAACQEKAVGADAITEINFDNTPLKVGDVLCTVTSGGATARLVVTDFVHDGSARVSFSATLWTH
nr:hypothetical protein GCM10025730_37990 [Promicromonospora thailandica]